MDVCHARHILLDLSLRKMRWVHPETASGHAILPLAREPSLQDDTPARVAEKLNSK